MASPVAIHVDTRDLVRTVSRYSGVANTTVAAAWKRGLRSMTRRVVGITPPANADSPRGRGGSITTEDKARGERALERDLAQIFEPVARGIGPRGQAPAGIHRRLFVTSKKPGKVLRSDRPDYLPYFVDARQLATLERTLKRRVGRLAGQWNRGVQALGIRSPAWVARHGTANGTHRLLFKFLEYTFEMSATDVPPSLVNGLRRRIGYAVNYAERGMTREIDHILDKAAGRAGFRR